MQLVRQFARGERPARFCAPVVDRETAAHAAPLGETEPDELVHHRHRAPFAGKQARRFIRREPRQCVALSPAYRTTNLVTLRHV